MLVQNRANTQTPTSSLTPFSLLRLLRLVFPYVLANLLMAHSRHVSPLRGVQTYTEVDSDQREPNTVGPSLSLVPRSDALTSFACAQRPRRSHTCTDSLPLRSRWAPSFPMRSRRRYHRCCVWNRPRRRT